VIVGAARHGAALRRVGERARSQQEVVGAAALPTASGYARIGADRDVDRPRAAGGVRPASGPYGADRGKHCGDQPSPWAGVPLDLAGGVALRAEPIGAGLRPAVLVPSRRVLPV
jgi:hypothetical protein